MTYIDKTLKYLNKENEDDTRKQNDLPFSWVDRINIVKMAIILKKSLDSIQFPIKILTHFFLDL